MLDDLDSLDWAGASHAYGPATDVPAQIRAILSSDKRERDSAFYELFGNIHHQGTIYGATVLALPFLIDILDADATPDREALAMLVASIIDGSGYYEVHYARERINPFTKKPMAPPPDLDQRIAAERTIVAQVREIGARAIPMLLPYLKHESADVRADFARPLAHYRSMVITVVPALKSALASESDTDTREVMQSVLNALTWGSA